MSYERKEFPLEHPEAFDAKVVITSDGKITNDGVRNPYPSRSYAYAHAAAIIWALQDVSDA